MLLGEWVRAERKRRGWTIKTLAERMTATGLTTANEPYLTQIETGKINAARIGRDKLIALATALEMTVDDLLQAAGVTDPPLDEAELAAMLNKTGVPDVEIADHVALVKQLTYEKRQQALSHLRWLLSEQHTEQARQAEAAQRAERRRAKARPPDLHEETQQRIRASC